MGDEEESLLLSASSRPIGGLLRSEAALQPWAKEDSENRNRPDIGGTLLARLRNGRHPSVMQGFWPASGMRLQVLEKGEQVLAQLCG
eukprot:5600976-Amphidinium_carterae.1